ncbi:MAG TPA: extracellular solute-binding protein [Solirubrobacteraceae bacterium]|jgi:iron(III) transport system substrate-binding protein
MAIALSILSVTPAAGCGGAGGGPGTSGTLTLYSAQHEGPTNALVKAFERQTGASVQVRFGADDELASQIAAEGSVSPADVFLAENSPPLTLLAEKGLLAKLASSTLARVPTKYNSPSGDWVGVAARETALIYDPRQVAPGQLPHSILDLAQPAWRGRLAIAPAEPDFQPVVAAVSKLDGEAAAERWLTGFQSNAKRYNDNEGIVAAVEHGQVAVGVVNHYYWYRLAQEVGFARMRSRLYYFGHGDPGALVDVSGAGVLRSSRRQSLAQRFVAFLVSSAGERALVRSGDWEYPLGSGVAPAPGLEPFDHLEAPSVAPADLGDGHVALGLLQRAGLL